jgi:uncharacterized protein involved in exopolysaccharide biosynthesis
MDLKFYLSLFLRRLPYFLLLLALGTAVGLTLATMLPPVYRAEARLVVESEQIPGDLAESTVQTEATEQLQIIQQRILTRDTLLEMANRLDIYGSGAGGGLPLPADVVVEDLRTRIQIVTTGGAQPRGPTRATIVTVSFTAPTAALSAAVTNEVVTLMLQENVSMRTTVASQTLDFFTQEVARLERVLAEQSAAILAFQQANQEALPDSLDFRRSQQAAAQERLLNLDREETTLKDRRARLVELYETTGRVDVAPEPNARLTPEARQLQALRDQLAGALAVLAPTNPRVKMLEAQIAAQERIVAAQAAGGTAPAAAGDPALTAYQLQLADLDGQLAFLAEQRAQITAELERLAASIAATPGNAVALDALQRDYANTRVQYDQAVANRARAETGEMIESLAKGQRISVIEQAVAPREPESPNRPLIAAAGVGGGFALGLALVALMELLNAAVRRPADLVARLGITPIGTLPLLRSRGQRLRRRLVIAAAFALVIGALPAGLWAVHTYYLPLDLLIDRLIGRLGLAAAAGPGAAAG